MVKVKRKVKMTLPELIEWAWKNDVNSRRFISSHNTSVTFSEYGNFSTSVKYIFKDETFTVEIEEEITKETEIPKLVSINRNNLNEVNINFNCSIRQLLDRSDYNYYILNDDSTLTLIWKDGELVGDE